MVMFLQQSLRNVCHLNWGKFIVHAPWIEPNVPISSSIGTLISPNSILDKVIYPLWADGSFATGINREISQGNVPGM